MWKFLVVVTSVFFMALAGLAQANQCAGISEEADVLGYVVGVRVEANGTCLVQVEIQSLSNNSSCPMWSYEGVKMDIYEVSPGEDGCPLTNSMIGFTARRYSTGEFRLENLVF